MTVAAPLPLPSVRVSFVGLCAPLAFVAALVPGGIFISVLLLLYLAFHGRALDALATLVLLTLSNPIMFTMTGLDLLRYVVLLTSLGLLWPGWKITDLNVAWSISLLAALIVFNSLVVSPIPSISLFKGGLLIFTLWTLFNTRKGDWDGFALRIDRAIPWYLLLSLPTLFIPSIGFARNGTGFQGLTNQPQAFGVISALLASWLIYRLWNVKAGLPLPIGLICAGVLLTSIILSEARTALLGLTAAFLFTWLIQMLRSARHLGLKILSSFLLIGAGVAATQTATFAYFLSKGTDASAPLEAASDSRGFLVERSLSNFQREPLLGIGFGIPSDVETAQVTYAPVVDIPISVALEKGVWVSATLEEQGVIGMGAIIILCLTLVVYAIKTGRYMGIPLLAFLLASNLGEMTMYSMGGLGLLLWLAVFAAFRIEDQSLPRSQ
ncbi:O-antigen ligase family protein [Deinococcus ficus]|uniref:O-antigen ligase-related domain-containing protein n=1 Tax=Deinococcus ficus TaxID=317577 RepID=A0A221T224_9DEIO|nr:O-antigen ligase family protein [Deinococcus ficus]ASN82945.1 hypothetical protein DFI_17310 [Deinococcus ficus]